MNDDFFDKTISKISCHILIKDKDTGEVLLNVRDSNNINKINPLQKRRIHDEEDNGDKND